MPASMAGLPACRWKSKVVALTNRGSDVTLGDIHEGTAPAPYQRLLLPRVSAVALLGVKYVSDAVWTTMLSCKSRLMPEAGSPRENVPALFPPREPELK